MGNRSIKICSNFDLYSKMVCLSINDVISNGLIPEKCQFFDAHLQIYVYAPSFPMPDASTPSTMFYTDNYHLYRARFKKYLMKGWRFRSVKINLRFAGPAQWLRGHLPCSPISEIQYIHLSYPELPESSRSRLKYFVHFCVLGGKGVSGASHRHLR